MGPRQIRRGEPNYYGKVKIGGLPELQWGHARFVVENPSYNGLARPPSRPSMGPRQIRRGEPGGRAPRPPARRAFNGATPNSAWRTAPGREWWSMDANLQWGHAKFGVE